VAVAVLAVFGVTFGAYQLLFKTKDGTLVVDVDGDADVRFQNGELHIFDADGKPKYTLKPSEKNKTLPPGKYQVEVAGADDLKVATDKFEISQGKKTTVRVTVDAASMAAKTESTADIERQAAERVLSLGGYVSIQIPNGWNKVTKAEDLPAGPYSGVGVNLENVAKFNDAEFERLKDFHNVMTLVMVSTSVTDAGFENLKSLKNLQYLSLNGVDIGDAGFAHFSSLTRLGYLGVIGSRVSDAGLAHLKGLTDLYALGLFDTKVTDAGMVHLKSLQLKQLGLKGSPVGDAGLQELQGLFRLNDLDVRQTKVTAAGVAAFHNARPLCKINWDGGIIEPTTASASTPAAAPAVSSDSDLLQGKWASTFEQSIGKIWSPDELRQMNKRLEVTGNRFVVNRVVDGKPGTYDGRFELNPKTTPKMFDFYGKSPDGKDLHLVGIYELKADEFRLCYSFGEPRPERFEWRGGSDINLVFRRAPLSGGFVPLFNGKDLTGWEGLPGYWHVENGAIVGKSSAEKLLSTHLTYKDTVADFDLRFQMRIIGQGQAGVRFRGTMKYPAQRLVYGPDLPLGTELGGIYYLDNRPGQQLKTPPSAIRNLIVRRDGFNDIGLKVVGKHATLTVNDVVTMDDDFPTFPKNGLLALRQDNTSPADSVEFRELRLRRLSEDSPKNDLGNSPVDGFVPLFNGKDLTGWKTHPDDKAVWKVEDGCLTAAGPVGHLFSDRGDYENFVFRIEAKINDGGNSGQYFRAKYQKSFPTVYEAQINVTQRDTIKTGSLYPSFNPKLTPEQKAKLIITEAPHKVNEWFTQEVTAIGNHIVIKVNDQTTVDFVDESNASMKGHFAIQHHDPTCKVMVRKVEVKELAAAWFPDK
jgi:uncharacterized protein (TIGR03067 family)